VGAVLLWVWIAVVVVALVILVAAALPLLRRLGGLGRAVRRLRLRQEEAMRLREKAAVLERTVLDVQGRADETQRKIAALGPGSRRK
jgi:Sec-independent protein translocase protein TatA